MASPREIAAQAVSAEALAGLARYEKWSGRGDSNPRLFAWEANTLPLSYARLGFDYSKS